MKRSTLFISMIVLVSGFWSATITAQDASPPQREYQGIPYMSGGIGEEERAQFLSAAPTFNLKLVFAEKTGSYLANVAVSIADGKGRKVLELPAEGPLLLAKLPAGDYRVTVVANGQEQVRNTKIPASGQRALMFRW